ncbi:MAG: glucosaminidase domain-containing protein [Nitriliruptoraceae bacterium]
MRPSAPLPLRPRSPTAGKGRSLGLRSRRARRAAAVALLVGGVSVAAVSAGSAVLDVDAPAEGLAGATSPASIRPALATDIVPGSMAAAVPGSGTGDGSGSRTDEVAALEPRTDSDPATEDRGGSTAEEQADAAAERAEGDAAPEPVYTTADGERVDAERIHDFLAGRGAPLADHADTFVAAGIAHDVDPRVVVGIAIAESNGGERLPAGSHNAWGWGGSGPHGLAAWDSWEESIHGYTERLGERYATDDVSVDFAQAYCPPNWRWWHDTVTWVIAQI